MKFWQILIAFGGLLGLVACSNTAPQVYRVATSTPQVADDVPDLAPEGAVTQIPASPTPSPEPTASPTPLPQLWVADYVPDAVVTHTLEQLGEGITLTTDESEANLRLEVGSITPVARWVYALVAPFPTIPDWVSLEDLSAAWLGDLDTGPFAGIPLKMDASTHEVLSQLWGPPPAAAVEILSPEELLSAAWAEQPSWAIIPFEDLDPQWKVLEIEGISPIQKDFVPAIYEFTFNFGLTGEMAANFSPEVMTNRDPEKFTDIMMTGVTALVRGTALTMERKGVLYPGEDIRPLTTAVDIMHVNNEIPFTPDCAFPKLQYDKLVFCSDVDYLDLLLDIGTDVVEVSGDHFGDHGPEGTLFTLDLYDEVGLPYYGGGRDLEDGRKAYLIEHNGNKIAFIGCNAKGSHYYAPADETTPGAVPCDFDWLESEIARLKDDGYLVVMTFQHVEYYSFEAQPDLIRDFGRMAAAGADIVSGSQSHQAHGMAFVDGKFVHYGLGNLFFDQYLYCENAVCDYAFMDRHIIYDGRHISTELIPIRFIDMARPRPMTPEEKAWFLEIIFEASGWK